ncbi:hypothetical protein MTR_7g407120 [Medicago truncatula]|uniref:Uncharacterized protein n=1 Tax=Medicago truncatula TaxID=3880 RepID=A0A072TVN9_MEDTR|nr:hypothetical protein MTR_7g407120 [Medicago truncatula]
MWTSVDHHKDNDKSFIDLINNVEALLSQFCSGTQSNIIGPSNGLNRSVHNSASFTGKEIPVPDGVQFTCSVSSDVLLSSVDGVQDLSINVDKQMVTYQLPRIVFINSLDYKEADPWEVVDQEIVSDVTFSNENSVQQLFSGCPNLQDSSYYDDESSDDESDEDEAANSEVLPVTVDMVTDNAVPNAHSIKPCSTSKTHFPRNTRRADDVGRIEVEEGSRDGGEWGCRRRQGEERRLQI